MTMGTPVLAGHSVFLCAMICLVLEEGGCLSSDHWVARVLYVFCTWIILSGVKFGSNWQAVLTKRFNLLSGCDEVQFFDLFFFFSVSGLVSVISLVITKSQRPPVLSFRRSMLDIHILNSISSSTFFPSVNLNHVVLLGETLLSFNRICILVLKISYFHVCLSVAFHWSIIVIPAPHRSTWLNAHQRWIEVIWE